MTSWGVNNKLFHQRVPIVTFL